MFFQIDPAGGQPIYAQIVRQVKFAIADETLRPGQLLPSVRQLSTQLAVNPNTVARAFQDLQNENIIETLRGRGVMVTKTAPAACRKQRKTLIGDRVAEAIHEAIGSGLSIDEVRDLVETQLQSLPAHAKDPR
ncbi:GntR family transcriptional regulator [Neorhodopirellula pilleata]|uniref:HTH-type transcriptional repressor YtrA n=1 Tax=Neorhodopirellula pilleata TaxID=2714738 RepID=A0A5C5ZKQ1_9BACT|nr:GntR family transcriptional regulator [Neorhodopirellula pilleata]TWT87810.1 HTH-type transcriptional repressor YtrA [Neorhodopirellula pilleata]